MNVRNTLGAPLHGRDGSCKELPGFILAFQQLLGTQLVEYPTQRRPVRPQEEELLPEALRLGQSLLIFILGVLYLSVSGIFGADSQALDGTMRTEGGVVFYIVRMEEGKMSC